ncbi:cytochrome P450 [Hymenopellis radicata]|nr:cytochrome P450 [Hymenopellis radicata]
MDTFYFYGILALLATLIGFSRRRRAELPLPPGPKGLPLVGHLFDRPVRNVYETYMKWAATYGDLVYYEVLGQPIIVVSSEEAANELFEKRSANYSDRPRMPFIRFRLRADIRLALPMFELMQVNWNLVNFRYSNTWRIHRKTFHQYFNANEVAAYQPVQLDASITLLHHLIATPEAFFSHVRHNAGSIMLRLTYGYDAEPVNDPFVAVVDKFNRHVSAAANPGSYLIDYLPILKWIPSWFPFAGFHREAKAVPPHVAGVRDHPFELVQKDMKQGKSAHTFVATTLRRIEEKEVADTQNTMVEVTKNVAAIVFAAGADTTVGGVLSTILAMVLNPDVLKQAHEELDVAVGRQRLPNFDDRSNLPLIQAIILEALRWRPVVPINVAHASIRDDVYNGYFIPAGSIVLGNSWALLHDGDVYRNPDIFQPTRFLGENREPDPTTRGVFGFGRRICPGRHLAMNSLFIAVASILWAFNIDTARDANGAEIIPDDKAYMDDFLMHPLPFKCKITPRFPEVPALVAMAKALS